MSKRSIHIRVLAAVSCCLLLATLLDARSVRQADAAVIGWHVQEAVKNRTKEEITRRWLQYMPLEAGSSYMDGPQIYEDQPSFEPGHFKAGKLKAKYIMDGLHAVNFARYLAGLPDDIEPDWTLAEQQQAVALSNAAIDQLDHAPVQAPEMNDELYLLGYEGAAKSNLHAGSPTFYDNVIAYMSDSDESNIERVGHRRWILNPLMTKTMFGMVHSDQRQYPYPYSSMYAVSMERPPEEISYDYIAWPAAGWFPLEWFAASDAWSLSLNPMHYDIGRTDQIRVRIEDEQSGQIWEIGQPSANPANDFLLVTGRGADPLCIIFRPKALAELQDGDTFRITVSGLYKPNGDETSISYRTSFFRMVPQLYTKESVIKLAPGEQMALEYGWTKPLLPGMRPYFDSSNPEAATIDRLGKVTAKQEGTAFVSLQGYFGDSHSVRFEIEQSNHEDKPSAWALQGYRQAKRLGFVEYEYDRQYQEQIDRKGYTTMAVRLVERILEQSLAVPESPFVDLDNDNISKAYGYGIIQGGSAKRFHPSSGLSRQEAAVILMNVYSKLNAASRPDPEQELDCEGGRDGDAMVMFTDAAAIAAWAKEEVFCASEIGLIQGTTAGRFDPGVNLSREEAFVLMVRLYDRFTEKKQF